MRLPRLSNYYHRYRRGYYCHRFLSPLFCIGAVAVVTTTSSTTGVFAVASSSPTVGRTLRWAVHGIGAEILHNAVLRPISKLDRRENNSNNDDNNVPEIISNDQNNNEVIDSNNSKEIAIVTGATGGIGTEICYGLIERNYHVFILARDVQKGLELQKLLGGSKYCTFCEYHADRIDQESLTKIQNTITGNNNRPVAVLVNNAGCMGGRKSDTYKVNLFGPTMLTLSLLPALKKQAIKVAKVMEQAQQGKEGEDDISSSSSSADSAMTTSRRVTRTIRISSPVIVNVGSSSHLRSDKVDETQLECNQIDTNLAAYGESKLGLMQFSNILRRTSLSQLSVIDAHPGLVWTPLLQKNLSGAKIILQKIGLSKILFKSPKEGAATILAAVDEGTQRRQHRSITPAATITKSNKNKQIYFVNCKPGGYSSKQSRDEIASMKLWNTILGPISEKVAPSGYKEVQECLDLK